MIRLEGVSMHTQLHSAISVEKGVIAAGSPPIMVVDDQEANRFSFRQILEKEGFAVVEAESGRAALEYLLQHPVSLLLLDVQMPGMNGFELTQAVREDERHRNTPILFVTATLRSEQFINYGYAVGAHDYLTKPVERHVLTNKVRLFHTLYQQQVALQQSNNKLAMLNEQLNVGAQRIEQEKRYVEGIFASMVEPLLVIDRYGRIIDCNPALEQVTGRTRVALLGESASTLFLQTASEGAWSMRQFGERLVKLLQRGGKIPSPCLMVALEGEPVVQMASHELERMLGYESGELRQRPLQALVPPQQWERFAARLSGAVESPGCAGMESCHFVEDGRCSRVDRPDCVLISKQGAPVGFTLCHFGGGDGDGNVDASGGANEGANGQQGALLLLLQNEHTLSAEALRFALTGIDREEELQLLQSEGGTIPVLISSALLDDGGVAEGVVLVLNDLSSRKRLESREQYAAFQSGIAEMSASILHNVGNTIQGMQAQYEVLQQGVGGLQRIEEIYRQLASHYEGLQGDAALCEEAEQRIVQASVQLPKALNETRSQIESELQRLGTGLNHIRDVVRAQQKGARYDTINVRFSLQALLDDLVVLTAAILDRAGVELKLNLAPNLPEISLPRNQLLQVMINLVSNAAEAIVERYRESGERGQRGVVEIECRVSRKRLVVVVRDNGNGIDPQILHKLVRFGFTTKSSGSGFGLHSVGNFVASLHGTVDFYSEGVGEGARITVVLPL
jgi:signal transduction histidine kinase/DNA-binding response OmpR family regulator